MIRSLLLQILPDLVVLAYWTWWLRIIGELCWLITFGSFWLEPGLHKHTPILQIFLWGQSLSFSGKTGEKSCVHIWKSDEYQKLSEKKERALTYGLFWVCVNGWVTREHHQAWQKNVMVSPEVNAFIRWVCISSSWGFGQRCMKTSRLICYCFSPLSSLEMDLTIQCHITHIAESCIAHQWSRGRCMCSNIDLFPQKNHLCYGCSGLSKM